MVCLRVKRFFMSHIDGRIFNKSIFESRFQFDNDSAEERKKKSVRCHNALAACFLRMFNNPPIKLEVYINNKKTYVNVNRRSLINWAKAHHLTGDPKKLSKEQWQTLVSNSLKKTSSQDEEKLDGADTSDTEPTEGEIKTEVDKDKEGLKAPEITPDTSKTTKVDSVITSHGIDPVTGMEIEDTAKQILIKGIPFSADTLAYYMITSNTDDIVTRSDTSKVIIWESSVEYLSVLNRLLPLVQGTNLEKEIQLRVEGYTLAKELINDFNNEHPDFHFSDLLESMLKKMQATINMGASYMSDAQIEGFNAYYKLRNFLPEKIMKIIFPFYAYDRDDPYCISTASRVFHQQIARIAQLGLTEKSLISSEKALKHDIEPYIAWFEKKIPPPLTLKKEEEHWAGPISSLKAIQLIDSSVSINITLRYAAFESEDALDCFAMAIIEKFRIAKDSCTPDSKLFEILTTELSINDKKEAIKNSLQVMSLNSQGVEALKEICRFDRNVFRELRDKLYPGMSLFNMPTDENVWNRIEQSPDLIASCTNLANPRWISFLVKKSLGVDIPVSKYWYETTHSLVYYKGRGEFPQVMEGGEDKKFKLLLSAE